MKAAKRGAILPIVPVVLRAEETCTGVSFETCALLDQGSTRSFCARRVVDQVGLKERREVSVISTLLDNDFPKSTCVDFTITGLFTRKTAPLRLTRVVVLNSFPDGLTETKADSELLAKWTHMKDLACINRCAEHLPVEILIGQNVSAALTPLEVRSGRDGDPFAIRTKPGWTINGPLKPAVNKDLSFNTFVEETMSVGNLESSFEEKLKRSWEVEDHEGSDKGGRSVEDQRVVTLWQSQGVRVTGHYQFHIPFKEEEPSLPDNLSMTLRRLAKLSVRLNRDEALKRRHVTNIESLISKGYADASQIKGSPSKTHHPVFNPKKTEKTRIIFDCAARTPGWREMAEWPQLSLLTRVFLATPAGKPPFIYTGVDCFGTFIMTCIRRSVKRFDACPPASAPGQYM
ncbi:hypothetical protein O3P69_006475 [Scylla paramamosain]|uniref:Peptidase aspartic putative domain-containing protein n=1 Tax=Scylla paramamosain TaxID=85552 RepID=A0AAW0U2K0_SCYPA